MPKDGSGSCDMGAREADIEDGVVDPVGADGLSVACGISDRSASMKRPKSIFRDRLHQSDQRCQDTRGKQCFVQCFSTSSET